MKYGIPKYLVRNGYLRGNYCKLLGSIYMNITKRKINR